MALWRLVALESLALLLMLATEAPSSAASKNLTGVVNLNTAAPELLGLLPGIGPSKARGIVAYRSRHPLRTVDELVRVKGIGRRMVRLLRPHLAISGPSTARLAAGTMEANASPAPIPPVSTSAAPRHPIGSPLSSSATAARGARIQAADRFSSSRANHCLPQR
jgi:competence ComEA-like helix-hairpin-helix protein